MSSNARPLKLISLKFKNKLNTKWLSSTANWSVELVNASTKNSYNGKNSMLTGARVIISPSEKLNFEFIQTAQWGDQKDKFYTTNIKSIMPINTNDGKNSSINKMAGFGLSYSVPWNDNIYRFYSQAIGEDEAGNLPSCYSWMAGFELAAPKMKFPTTVTFEAIDTRVKKSTYGNCGPNTMYNNSLYNYINYDTVIGAPIDTEGTSLEIFGRTHLNKNLRINYSSKFLSINDKDYLLHRLSSKRSLGTVTTLGLHWKKNRFGMGGNISYQNIILDKVDISNSTIFTLFTTLEF